MGLINVAGLSVSRPGPAPRTGRLLGWAGVHRLQPAGWARVVPQTLAVSLSCCSTSCWVERWPKRVSRHPAHRGVSAIAVVGGLSLGGLPCGTRQPGHRALAWASTKHALQAIRLSMGIELLTGLATASAWLIGVMVTA